MKKIILGIIVLIVVGFIGIHHLIYANDYKRINTLNDIIYNDKTNLIDIQTQRDNTKTELDKTKQGNPLIAKLDTEKIMYDYQRLVEEATNVKSKYDTDVAELEHLKLKTSYLNIFK